MDTTLLLAPLIFLIGCLMIGAVLKRLLKRTSIPYTVALFVTGVILGVVAREGHFLNGKLFNAVLDTAGNLNPDWILYLFLPILIFSAAYDLNVHIFRKTLLNTSLLAVPGMVVAMILTAALLYGLGRGVEEYNLWNWHYALLFGALISATDPVAVVALLQELGASKRFSTLIDGESMLNDGTGIVLFMLFFGPIVATSGTPTHGPVVSFLIVVVGGCLTGLAIAWLCLWFLRRVRCDRLVQNSTILLAAYLTFLVAQDSLQVSGVIALVVFGLTVSYWGEVRLDEKVSHFVKEFWDLLSYMANTLIFIIVGVIIALKVHFSWVDVGVLLCVYLGVNVARSVMVALLYPILTRTGYGLSKREAVILSWGGLRGALGLTLALIVSSTMQIPEPIRRQTLFLTAGIVTLTLLVNATTIKWLLDKLGLAGESSSQQLLNESLRGQLHDKSLQYFHSLQKREALQGADWPTVEAILPPPATPLEETVHPNDLLANLRRRILTQERQTYASLYGEGILSLRSLRTLIGTVDQLLDKRGREPLSSRSELFRQQGGIRWIARLNRYPRLVAAIDAWLHARLVNRYDLARGMILGQQAALRLVDEFASAELIDEERMGLKQLRTEIEENIGEAKNFIEQMATRYPRSYRQALTQKSIRMMRRYERRTVEEFVAQGMIPADEAEEMLARLPEEKEISNVN